MQENKVLFKYQSIELFHNYLRNVLSWADYNNQPLPTLTFNGLVKLHGTNSSVVFDPESKSLVAQSKNLVLTPEADNMGFCKFMLKKETILKDLMEKISQELNLKEPLIMYGEWAGSGISKKVALSQIPPSWFIFSMATFNSQTQELNYFSNKQCKELLNKYLPKEQNIYSLFDFVNYQVTIDFNNLGDIEQKIEEMTTAIDQECPVSKALGATGHGEGIVWTCESEIPYFHLSKFKSKGPSHKVVKDRKPPQMSEQEAANIQSFVDFTVTTSRLEQGLDYLNEMGKELSIKSLGDFLKWIIQDCVKEEKNLLKDLNLTTLQVAPNISKIAKQWYFEKLQEDTNNKMNKLKL